MGQVQFFCVLELWPVDYLLCIPTTEGSVRHDTLGKQPLRVANLLVHILALKWKVIEEGNKKLVPIPDGCLG